MAPTPSPQKDDPNRPETEADWIRAEGLRRLQVRRLFKAPPAPTPDSSPSPSSTPAVPPPEREE